MGTRVRLSSALGCGFRKSSFMRASLSPRPWRPNSWLSPLQGILRYTVDKAQIHPQPPGALNFPFRGLYRVPHSLIPSFPTIYPFKGLYRVPHSLIPYKEQPGKALPPRTSTVVLESLGMMSGSWGRGSEVGGVVFRAEGLGFRVFIWIRGPHPQLSRLPRLSRTRTPQTEITSFEDLGLT